MTKHFLASGVQRRFLAQSLLGQVHHFLGDSVNGARTFVICGGRTMLLGQLAGIQTCLIIRFGRLYGIVELVGRLLDAIHAVDEQLLEVVFGFLWCRSLMY